MKVVAVLNQKGGSGKSTIATNLARALQRRECRVMVADCDAQGTARDWALSAPDGQAVPHVAGHERPVLEKQLPDVSASFDVCVIDGAAKIERLSVSAIKAADVVLIPVQPSAADLWAAEDLVELIRARRELTGSPEAAFVVSRAVVGTRVAGAAAEALERFGLPLLEGRTHQRVAYTEAMGQGRGVQDLDDASKASREIDRITDEVQQLLRDS